MDRPRREDGTYMTAEEILEFSKKKQKEAQKEHGYSVQNNQDYLDDLIDILEENKLITSKESKQFGFTNDFYQFMGFQLPGREYYVKLKEKYRLNISKPKYSKIVGDFIEDTSDSREYYTPLDDLYSTPSGGDMVSDFGRVPTSHLVSLCNQRLGIANRACLGTANDVLKNGFDFVSDEDPEKIIKKPEIMRWMRKSRFTDKFAETLNLCFQTGLGHLISRYPNETGMKNAAKEAPKTRPNNFEAFSAYRMTPASLSQFDEYDYDKQKWDFIGGTRNITIIDHSRVYVLEVFRIEGGLRGLALPEVVWTPLMCYLNTMYYILKSLSQLGTNYIVFESQKEYPTTEETQKYISLGNLMRANNTYVMGKNAQFKLENAAAKIGGGIESYLEFLREDICAGWIYPKNQLFGRALGGGLEGAGAIISKEDYLGSNISTKQLLITNDIMYILSEVCGFKNLDNITLRWKIDLHKSEEQRLKERMMRSQAEMVEIQLEMSKLNKKLYDKQVKLQTEMAKVQLEMFKKNPQAFMMQSQKDEENVKEKEIEPEKQKDFIDLSHKYDTLQFQFNENKKLMKLIQNDMIDNQKLITMNKV